MKLKQWLYGATALAMLAACSDKDIPGNDPGNEGPVETATGYLALQINLPQETQTRAEGDNAGTPDNVSYADGESWEYRVESGKAKLVLFKTTKDDAKESDAVCVNTYNLNRAFAPTSPGDNSISSSSVEAVAVNIDTANETTDYLWALVMLNVPDGLTLPTQGQEFGEYMKQIADGSVQFLNGTPGNSGSIFMTNAPLSNKAGATFNPVSDNVNPTIQTLVKLGTVKNCLKPTLQEARENVCGCIYVERALAKLTAKVNEPNIEIYDKDGVTIAADGTKTGNKLNVKIASAKFGAMNANAQSYIIRNTSGFPAATADEAAFAWNLYSTAATPAYYRMIGSVGMPELYSPLHTSPQYLYRTYWCLDPNYNVDMAKADKLTTALSDVTTGKIYVKENTFNVEHQNYGNTTLAVFELQLSVDGKEGDLYIVNGNHNAVFTSEVDATSHVYEYVLAQDKVKNALQSSIKADVNVDGVDLSPYVNITFERDEAGIFVATNLSLNEDEPGFTNYFATEASNNKFVAAMGGDSGVQDMVQRVNLLFVIEKYEGGKSYYVIPVQHFGDKSTPWTKSDKNQTLTSEAYPGTVNGQKYSARNYLGRYGMVRNNWYEINVTSLTGIGSPVVPEINLTLSDDYNEIKQYIGIETHILSWAKRTQSVDF